jgi:hypothetical protein
VQRVLHEHGDAPLGALAEALTQGRRRAELATRIAAKHAELSELQAQLRAALAAFYGELAAAGAETGASAAELAQQAQQGSMALVQRRFEQASWLGAEKRRHLELMAKDLLKLQRSPHLNLRTLLRPAVFVPESKGLNELLRDFRSNRNHLAIVIDEFGSTAGLITIEDVLEEIVGEIEDEFDDEDGESGIYTLADGSYRVAGDASINAVNEALGSLLASDDVDTIGGLIAQQVGRVPRRGEVVSMGGLVFSVMLTRGGAVRWFKVTPAPEEALASDGA